MAMTMQKPAATVRDAACCGWMWQEPKTSHLPKGIRECPHGGVLLWHGSGCPSPGCQTQMGPREDTSTSKRSVVSHSGVCLIKSRIASAFTWRGICSVMQVSHVCGRRQQGRTPASCKETSSNGIPHTHEHPRTVCSASMKGKASVRLERI